MNRRQRTEILIQGAPTLSKKLATIITDSYKCREVVAPRYGLTMVKMRESAQKSLFYLGEVLVTEAKVMINNKIGVGIVVGMEDELALNLAIIDAAYNANLEETNDWKNDLLQEAERIKSNRAKEQQNLLKTKVDFQTMDI